MLTAAQLAFCFLLHLGFLALVTCRVCIPTSVQATKKLPETPEVCLLSDARPAKVTIRINYHI